MRAVALDFACRFYNLLGNVAGSSDMLNLTSYNNGTKKIPAFPQCVVPEIRSYDGKSYGFSFGYASSGDNGTSAFANQLPYTTALLHGNVNLVTNAVTWDAATADHNLPPSLYLAAKPGWFGTVPWPPIGPDVAGYTNKIPAQLRYEGISSAAAEMAAGRPCAVPFTIDVIAPGIPRIRLLRASSVKGEIYTLSGRRIRTLADRRMSAGPHTVRWNTAGMPAGIYVCCLSIDGLETVLRVALK